MKLTAVWIQVTVSLISEAKWRIYVSKLTIIGADNGLSPGWRQAIIWYKAGILLIRTLGTNFSEILIEIHTFSFNKIWSDKWQQFCLSLNVLVIVTTAKSNRSRL